MMIICTPRRPPPVSRDVHWLCLRVRIRKGAALSYDRVKSGVWGRAPAGCGAEPREEIFGVFNALLRIFQLHLMPLGTAQISPKPALRTGDLYC